MSQPLSMHLLSNADRIITKPATSSSGGIVVSQHRVASEIGARVLTEGGSAIDAAIATSFAVSVMEPWMSGIGGVGGLLYAPPQGEVLALDFNTRSPRRLDPADYPIVDGIDNDLFGWPNVQDGRNLRGATSVLVPSLIAGLGHAHGTWGRLPWARLVEPSIDLARAGLEVSWYSTTIIASAAPLLARDPASAAWLLPNGQVPVTHRAHPNRPRLRLPNPALADTLARIATGGPRTLYEGELARAIIADLQAAGSRMDLADLAAAGPVEVTPLRLAYRDQIIHVLPELNGGVTLVSALRRLAERRLGQHPDADTFLAYADVLFAAFEERFAAMGDDENGRDHSCTTHISVVDRDGAMVSLTQTLLSTFGARLTLPSTGMMMNNGVNWFDPRPGSPNSLGPNKRPLKNICPAIMTGPKGAVAIGGAGGRRIVPMVLQVLSLIADHGLSLDAAVDHARIDVSGDPWMTAQPELGTEILHALARHHRVITGERDAYPYNYALASAVQRTAAGHVGKTEPTQPWAAAVGEELHTIMGLKVT